MNCIMRIIMAGCFIGVASPIAIVEENITKINTWKKEAGKLINV